jgi:hypothetical protein
MQSDASRIPSVACLPYLAADQIAPAGHERENDEGDEGALQARLGAPDPAVGNDRGGDVPELAGRRTLKLHLEGVTSKDRSYEMPPGRRRTHTTRP